MFEGNGCLARGVGGCGALLGNRRLSSTRSVWFIQELRLLRLDQFPGSTAMNIFAPDILHSGSEIVVDVASALYLERHKEEGALRNGLNETKTES